MDILIVPVPLFNKNMAVEAYLLDYQKGNDYLGALGSGIFDGGGSSPALETINMAGIEAFTLEQPVFIPVSSIMLLSDLGAQCAHPPKRVVFVFDSDLKPEEPFLSHIRTLRNQGFRIAFRNVASISKYAQLLEIGDYIIIDTLKHGEPELTNRFRAISSGFRNLTIIASGIQSREDFHAGIKRGAALLEGSFYRTPVTRGKADVDPLRANLIRLLNIVRDENFEFDIVADTVQRDTALSVSLLRLINSPYIGLSQRVKNISHAVTLLGQNEVRKWVTTSVSRLLGSDKPSEITKLSLTRAKFCDNLAPLFNMSEDAGGLFMMGLFSVLDIILDMPMEKAFEKVLVSDDIQDAIVSRKGRYFPLYDFILKYESADWTAVSHQIILHDLTVEKIYDAYIEAISWYSDLVLDEINHSGPEDE